MTEGPTPMRSVGEFQRDVENLNGHAPGESIEELAANGIAEDETGQTLLDFGDQLNLKMAGRKPTESKLKIRGVQRDIQGQLGDKGDDEDYAFVVIGRMHNLSTPYRRDESKRCIGKKRVHELDPMEVVRVPDALLEQFLTAIEEHQAD